MNALEDVLDEIEEYLEERADCDCEGDPLEYVPNREMRMLAALVAARGER